ncbi:hypothetical protein CROQUDRAFT_89816 [Cronartium quercuum f. sp. fusiforme G11]|uniref:Uncharacterized protein n=1 Tax=Cronartium quercuum f. sp. fusiforme G11 TaxID=708437 RepID=A0A9P6NMK8_9BASI|nr:hypothetical protein CROQUDRAFT_89816 [Cronartium quercuum f. sp. fusiforme G11]
MLAPASNKKGLPNNMGQSSASVTKKWQAFLILFPTTISTCSAIPVIAVLCPPIPLTPVVTCSSVLS